MERQSEGTATSPRNHVSDEQLDPSPLVPASTHPSTPVETDTVAKTEDEEGNLEEKDGRTLRLPSNGFRRRVTAIWDSKSTSDPDEDLQPGPAEDAPFRFDPHRPPMAFCQFIVNYPKLAFSLAISIHVVFVVTTLVLVFVQYDIFPAYFKELPLDVRNDVSYLRSLAWYNKRKFLKQAQSDENISLGGFIGKEQDLVLFFEGDNVLTRENLQNIRQVTNELLKMLNKDEACAMDFERTTKSTYVCAEPDSLLRLFDTFDPEFNNIPIVLYNASLSPLKHKLEMLVSTDSVITPTEAKSRATRVSLKISAFVLPMNIEGEEYLIKVLRDKLYELADRGAGDMKIYFSSVELFKHDIFLQVIYDLMLAIGSFIFIFCFMLVQTGSLFLTCLAISSMLSSFLGANLIYRIILDYRYFGIFHVLSIFLVLGIGADDIFVFNDTWRATAHEKHAGMAERLSSCYRRASLTTLITSFTTTMAFVTNALSPLLPISSFGIFSAVLVTVNYLSVITLFPTCIIIYHRTVEHWTWPCFRQCSEKTNFCTSNVNMQDKTGHDPNAVVLFLKGPFHRIITHKYYKWIFIVVSLLVTAPFAFSVFDIEISKSQVQFYRTGHNYYHSQLLGAQGFKRNSEEETVEIFIVMGLKTADLSMCHKSDFICEGKVIYDDNFDLNPKPAQRALMALCDKLYHMTDHPDLLMMRDPVTNKTKMKCFINFMDNFYRRYGNDPRNSPEPLNLSLPTSELKFEKFFEIQEPVYRRNLNENFTFYRYFETLLQFALDSADHDVEEHLYSLVGVEKDDHDTGVYDFDSYYGTRLRFAAIAVQVNISSQRLDFKTGLKHHDAWENFVKEEMKKMPASAQGWQYATLATWHDFKRQEALIQSATQGMIVGLCLALLVLTLATTNIIISVIATCIMALVTISVCGAIPLLGWKISAIESINLSLVVGLAVDYVVHLSEAYNQSPHQHRIDKVQDMLESRGLSVVSGAFSTLGASVFMMGAQIQFFIQFGIFLFLIIGFSCAYSLFLFTPIMATIGPEGESGSFVPLTIWLWDHWRGRNSQHVTCPQCGGKGFYRPDLIPLCDTTETTARPTEVPTVPSLQAADTNTSSKGTEL